MATSNRRGRVRRQHLIETALRSFAEHGYRGVSTATIAQEAGISEPGLIHHFPTKADLLLAVIEHYEARSIELIQEALSASDGSFSGALLALAGSHEADPTFIRLFTVLVAESVSPAHPAHEWFVARYDRVRAEIADRFREEQRRGQIRRRARSRDAGAAGDRHVRRGPVAVPARGRAAGSGHAAARAAGFVPVTLRAPALAGTRLRVYGCVVLSVNVSVLL